MRPAWMQSGESMETRAGAVERMRLIISSSDPIMSVSANVPRRTHQPEGLRPELVRSIPTTVAFSAGVPPSKDSKEFAGRRSRTGEGRSASGAAQPETLQGCDEKPDALHQKVGSRTSRPIT